LCLEGFFFGEISVLQVTSLSQEFQNHFIPGLYSGIFALHLQMYASRKETDDSSKQNIVFHALWVLYVLSAATMGIDTVLSVDSAINDDITHISTLYRLSIVQPVVFACCDFITQSILIHRCWIVWGCNIHVVIIPSILAFAYLVTWIAGSSSQFIEQGTIINEPDWGNTLVVAGLSASMTVNAVVTGLIVFRIFKVFRRVKSVTTSAETSLGITGGRELRSIIFIIIESGMALLSIQLIRLGIAGLTTPTTAEVDAYQFIASIHEMINGITPTIILVRVSMGLSFRDEPSLVEAVGSLQFAAYHPNPIGGMGSLSEDGNSGIEPDDLNASLEMVDISQKRRDNDDGSDEIQMVDR